MNITELKALYEARMRAVEELRGHGETLGDDEPSAEFLVTENKISNDITVLGAQIERGLAELERKDADAELEARMAGITTEAPASEVRAIDGDVERLAAVLRGESRSAEFAPAESRDLLAGTATDGAELVPTSLHSELIKYVENYSNVAGLVKVINTSGGETLNIPTVSTNAAATWEGEGDAIAEADPQFATVSLSAYKLARLTQVSSELLQDSSFNVVSTVLDSAAQGLALAIDTSVVVGTGTGQPEGFALVSNLTESDFASASAITANELIDTFHGLAPQFRSGAKWILRDSTVQYVRKLTNAGTTDYVWQPGLALGQPDKLLGYDVVQSPDMPAIASDAVTVAFGDWAQAYVLRIAGGVRVERSSDFAFANDLETFRFIVRLDGKLLNSNAYVTRAQLT